jgi:hypothetical protein
VAGIYTGRLYLWKEQGVFVNFVIIIVSALLALGAAVNAGSPVPAVTSAVGSVAAPTPSPTPAPVHYDVIGAGGPT